MEQEIVLKAVEAVRDARPRMQHLGFALTCDADVLRACEDLPNREEVLTLARIIRDWGEDDVDALTDHWMTDIEITVLNIELGFITLEA